MASHLFKRLTALRSILHSNTSNNNVLSRLSSSLYEPDYLEAMKPKYPLYPPLTVKIRGYNFATLESYQSWVHKIANTMDFDVDDSYPVPARDIKVTRFKHNTTVVDAQYLQHLYERQLKICNVPSVRLPIFMRILEAALPEGVLLDIDEWSQEKENFRFVPDTQLLELKDQLEDMSNPKLKK